MSDDIQAAEIAADVDKQEATFSQADVDRIVKDRVKKLEGEISSLRAQAESAKTVEEQVADLQAKLADTEIRALRSNVATTFGVSAEDRDLFLTGTDEVTLTAQAKRLSERVTEQKQKGNVARKEGGSVTAGGGDDQMRDTVRQLFASANYS